jgi:DNA-binding NarL/FixJ family response regulator
MIRIIIADDHTLFRVGLRQMLHSYAGLEVVAEATQAAETVAAVKKVDADLLVMDLTMPGTTGTRLIEQVREATTTLPILVLSMHDEPATVRRALQAGANGYITKESSPETLHSAVTRIAAGERYIDPAVASSLAFESVNRVVQSPHQSLSEREWQVLKLITEGHALAQIAEQLHISPKTITTHKTHLMEKLGVANNAELIRYALENQLFA